MEQIVFDYSPKNIPLGDNKVYLELLVQQIERFSKSISWRCFFKLNPDLKTKSRQLFGFKSIKAPPKIKQLKEFEDSLANLVKSIKFRKRSRPFLSTLKKEISKINKQKNMIIPSDKTSNNYLVPAPQYKT